MDAVLEDDGLMDLIVKLLEPSEFRDSHASELSLKSGDHETASFGHQNHLSEKDMVARSEEGAWAVSQRLDEALSRVQAAWLIAHLCDTLGLEAGRKLVSADYGNGGAARGLVGLLAEAVGADAAAAESDAELSRYSVRIRGRRGALGDVDSEW